MFTDFFIPNNSDPTKTFLWFFFFSCSLESIILCVTFLKKISILFYICYLLIFRWIKVVKNVVQDRNLILKGYFLKFSLDIHKKLWRVGNKNLFTRITCPRMGNMFTSLHSFPALSPVQLKTMSYFPHSSSKHSIFRLTIFPPPSLIL